MIEITLEKGDRFRINAENKELLVNDKVIDVDILATRPFLHLTAQGKNFTCYLLELDKDKREAYVRVNGKDFRMTYLTQTDLLLKAMGLEGALSKAMEDLKAPMPGLVVKVLVNEGEDVAKGSPLLLLEAMKMENTIKSNGEGKVKHIACKDGDKVEKGALLIQFE